MEYLKPHSSGFGPVLSHFMDRLFLSLASPEVAPAEPTTKPTPVITPQPSKDDPFNVPAPKINPTPKGLL